jgi:dihydrofolate reductase
MKKLIATEFVTVDGVMEDPGGSEHTKHGGWSMKFGSPEYGKYKFDELFAAGALLLGRVTYEGFASAWPSMRDEAGFGDRMNSIPKYVVSTSLQEAKWNNSHVIRGNVAEEVTKLTQQADQDILIYGSATLVNTLTQHQLIDEYRLMVNPVVLGSGKRLFDGVDPVTLSLIENKTLPAGVVVLAYEPKARA